MRFHREKTASSIHAFRLFAASLAASLAFVWTALPARAASLVRDADIEHALSRMAAPLLTASGLGGNVRILLINDRSLNAFVIDSQHIFIHTGMISKMDTPEKLQAVIAHEAAHIANGHIARRMANIDSARSLAGLGMALALVRFLALDPDKYFVLSQTSEETIGMTQRNCSCFHFTFGEKTPVVTNTFIFPDMVNLGNDTFQADHVFQF